MKRKAIVLLSSVLTSALLVGGAFAAYAVTDNAQEKGIYTTPGTITPTKTAVIDWGKATSLVEEVGDLQPGTPKRAGAVSLVATVSDSNVYLGNLLVHYEDKTTIEESLREAKFIDYLNVYVYEGDLEEPDEDKLAGSLLITEEDIVDYSKNIPLEGSASGELYTIFVELDASAEAVAEKIQNDRVYVGFDWNKADEDYYPVGPVPTTDKGYYLVGSFNSWKTYKEYEFVATEVEGEYKVDEVTIAATDEFKAKELTDNDPVWYPAEGDNLTVPAGKYSVLFSPAYRAAWESTVVYENMFGRGGHFWFMPIGEEQEEVENIYVIYDVENEETLFTLEMLEEKDPQDRDQAYALVNLPAGTKFAIRNLDLQANFLPAIEEDSFGGNVNQYVTVHEGYWLVEQGFEADVYAKFAWENDGIYFGLKGEQEEEADYPETAGQYALISDDLALVADLAQNTAPGKENEYYATNVNLKVGDKFVLYDSENKATWTVKIDGWSYGGESESDTAYEEYLVIENGYYVVQKAHAADIYVKFIYDNDNVYFGLHSSN